MSSHPEPVACRLTTVDAARQALEWTDLQHHSTATAAIDGGARMRFPVEFAPQVEDLAAREAACCTFLTITTHPTGDELVLDVTSENPEAAPVIALLSGLEMSPEAE